MSRPLITQNFPFAVELEEGKTYAWCACGRSANPPFCDGTHQGTDFSPVVFSPGETKTAHLCGCGSSNNPPFCDGSHSKR